MTAQSCTTCNAERKLVYAEPAAQSYELRSYRCPRCKSILQIVEERDPVLLPREKKRRAIVRSILDFVDESELGFFGECEREVIERAFWMATDDLRDTGQRSRMYAKVAKHIVEIVRSGERDPEKVRDRALTAFGRKQR